MVAPAATTPAIQPAQESPIPVPVSAPSGQEQVPDAPTPAPRRLPPLTDRERFLLALYTTSKYDLCALTTGSSPASPDELLAFSTSEAVQAHLELHQKFAATSLQLRAIEARKTVINSLEQLVHRIDDPVEKRATAVNLCRATSAPIIPQRREPRAAPEAPSPPPAGTPRPHASPHSHEANSSSLGAVQPLSPTRAPSPTYAPRPDLSIAQVAELLTDAVRFPNRPEADAGPATLAAFCDTNALINNIHIPADQPEAAIEIIRRSHLGSCTRALEAFSDPPVTTTHPDGSQSATQATRLRTAHGYLSVQVRLKRSTTSRHPDCWLLADLRTGPFERPKPPP